MTHEHQIIDDDQAEVAFQRLQDEIQEIAAVAQAARDGDQLAGQMTMWLDYMVQRALGQDGQRG